ncbi:DNA replication and repair protein RecN [Sulfurivirga caldicuralii]|uniref:DNA repair protein RecN n=1 Tax=Sulfurivirga caldicuralii TaxID=364032 RepID=A0A1N6E337_9GAMM|nr:DNA repair protein RecN [Sulfurivirga caldicuralii]SIN77402.1 DNA replication and repair protein RecN [Sulfurivirga caldicuralii]
MLSQLTIRNLAVIKQVDISFETGFTALTGETGAGKSILLDALGLIAGNRADSGMVRHGEKRADIQAEFTIADHPALQRLLEEEALLDEESPHTLHVRRVVQADGGSRAWINGIRVTAQQLKEIVPQLLEIHSQHAHQQLLDSTQQRRLLDGWLNAPELLAMVAETFQRWQRLQHELETLRSQQHEQAQRLAALTLQLQQFAELAPSRDEYETLSQQHHTLAHAQEYEQGLRQAIEALDGNDSAVSAYSQALAELEPLTSINPELENTVAQLNEQLIVAQELARDLTHEADSISHDPEALAQVEARLAQYHALAKHYLLDPEALEEKHQALQAEYDQLSNLDTTLDTLEMEVAEGETAYRNAAEQLSEARAQAGEKLAQEIEAILPTIGLEKARFAVEVTPTATPQKHGMDQVAFMVTTNPGQPLQPLKKVASGGELARISLALELVLTSSRGIDTLIFDEVDVGIGGGVAEQVGRLMQRLGTQRQVLAITHQPQVAACADHHLHIEKQSSETETETHIAQLDEATRVQELARMLGGQTLTDTTLRHAEELLGAARRP